MSPTKTGLFDASCLERLAQLRQRWETLRRSTAPSDRVAAEAGVRAAYRAAQLPPPEIVWADGPDDVAEQWQRRQLGGLAGPNVKSLVVSEAARKAEQRLGTLLSSRDVRWLAREALPFIRGRTGLAVRDALRATHGPSKPLLTDLLAALDRLRGLGHPRWRQEWLNDGGVAPYDCPPFHNYEFVEEVTGRSEPVEPLRGLMAIVASAGWLIAFRSLAILIERPAILKFDEADRMHAAKGPALAWRDGFACHAWKGVYVPEWLTVRPECIEPARIEREPDVVIRHCMVEIYGVERFVRAGAAEQVARDETGILWQHHWRRGGIWAAVEVVNGTPEPDQTYRHYFLQVPATLRTARQAVAWTYGMTEQDYGRLRLRT